MTILSQLNSPVMYLTCGIIIAFVAVVAIVVLFQGIFHIRLP